MDLTNARSMELFKRLGLAEKLRDAGVPRENAFDISWVTSLVGHELYRFHYPSPNEKREIIRREHDGHHASEPPLRVRQVDIAPVLQRAIVANPMVTVRHRTAAATLIHRRGSGVRVQTRT